MSDEPQARDELEGHEGEDHTPEGEAVERNMPDPEEMPGETLGRDEGEGKPGPKDPGKMREVAGG